MIQLISILFLIASIYARTRTVQNCEYAYLDEPCPTANCLPNAIMLTSGFDITDEQYRADVLGLEWGPNYFTNNGILYTTPSGVSVIPLSESDDITGTFIMRNTSDSERWQSYTYVDKKDYIVGMCSHTIDTYQSITSQYQQTSQVGYVIYYYAFYEVIVPYNEQVLDSACYNNIMNLPEDYNQDMYFQFIESFGTHFITQSKWGLKYKFLSSFKECLITTTSESYTYNQVQTDGWIHSSEHTTYSGSSSTDTYYTSRRYTSEMFEGGNISYHSSDLWDQWVVSGSNMINPVPIALSLKPIYMIINDTIRQNNMFRAYTEYLQMKKEQQQLVIEQKRLGPHTVSIASFNIDILPTFKQISYITAPTTIQLAADATSNIFGYDGDCNHLSGYAYHQSYGGYIDCLGQDCVYDYCITQFTCERNSDGKIKAGHYFNPNDWVNSVRSQYDKCIYSDITKYNSVTNEMDTYYYNCDGFLCYGSMYSAYMNNYDNNIKYSMTYMNPFAVIPGVVNVTMSSYDGLYQDYLSMTSFDPYSPPCGGYSVCYMDCDNMNIYLDAQGNPNVGCTC